MSSSLPPTERERLSKLVYAFDRFRMTPIVDNDFVAMRIAADDELRRSREYLRNNQQVMSLEQFWYAQAEWSQATFGSDKERGPAGPLKHMAKEVKEAIAEVAAGDACVDETDKKIHRHELLIELVDLQFLIFDATRRAGFGYGQLVAGCTQKLEINKNRQWQKPTTDEPVEHVRDGEQPRG